MPAIQTRCRFAATAGLLALAAAAAQANVIWAENFDAATPGQAVSAAPLNWTADAGKIAVGATPHPGWQGNAIVGSLSVDGGGQWAQASLGLPAAPKSGVIRFGFDAWAPTTSGYGGHIKLNMDNGDFFYLEAWTNCCIDNSWIVTRWSAATASYATVWISDSDFMRDRTVRGTLELNYGQQSFSASFADGTTIVTTPSFGFDASAGLTTVRVYEDLRGGTGVVDFDNLQLAAVPEPGTWFLLAGGLAALGLRLRSRH